MREITKTKVMRAIVDDLKDELLSTVIHQAKNKATLPDLSSAQVGRNSKQASMLHLLLAEIGLKVATELKEGLDEELKKHEGSSGNSHKSTNLQANDKRVRKALAKAERKLTRIAEHELLHEKEGVEDKGVENISLDDLDDIDLATIEKLEARGVRVIFPNLKYRKPKYKNVESVLKYVEGEEGANGIKLVIMNFND